MGGDDCWSRDYRRLSLSQLVRMAMWAASNGMAFVVHHSKGLHLEDFGSTMRHMPDDQDIPCSVVRSSLNSAPSYYGS